MPRRITKKKLVKGPFKRKTNTRLRIPYGPLTKAQDRGMKRLSKRDK